MPFLAACGGSSDSSAPTIMIKMIKQMLSPLADIHLTAITPHTFKVLSDKNVANSYKIYRNTIDSNTGLTTISITPKPFYQDTG